MPERDPYDFSALAPDEDFGDDSTSVLDLDYDPGAAHQFDLSEEQLTSEMDFEVEFEAMVGEGLAGGHAVQDDEQFRQLQAALQRLGEGLVDLQLEADEAWLEALLLEEDAGPGQSSPGAFDDVDFDDEL